MATTAWFGRQSEWPNAFAATMDRVGATSLPWGSAILADSGFCQALPGGGKPRKNGIICKPHKEALINSQDQCHPGQHNGFVHQPGGRPGMARASLRDSGLAIQFARLLWKGAIMVVIVLHVYEAFLAMSRCRSGRGPGP